MVAAFTVTAPRTYFQGSARACVVLTAAAGVVCCLLLSVGVCLMGPDCQVSELWQCEGLRLQQLGLQPAVPGGEAQRPHGPDRHTMLSQFCMLVQLCMHVAAACRV
jgi:hypothetical protein